MPDTRLPEIMRELAVIRDEFNTAKDAFLLRYDQSVQDWIAKHPQWGSIIAGSTVSEEYVRSRIDFRWQVFQVAQPAAVNATQNLDNLNDDIGQLGDTLFDEVAKAAGEAWTRCYAGKTEITRKALSPLKSIYDKLMGLTFVEPRVAPVAELLDTAFRSIPKRGAIKGSMLIMLQGLVSLLQHPQTLMEHGQMILEGRKNPRKVLESLFMAKCAVQAEAEARAASGEDDEMEPVFGHTAPQPVIESHGLW